MENTAPKVFISYSWDNELHKEWVRKFSFDLRRNGVNVILDQWHLKFADDIAAFMDNNISEADYILLICTPNFAEKSNSRSGGVGYEIGIITGELMVGASASAKFIPILRSGNPSSSLPNYLKTKLFVDFRIDEQYERSLNQLLRHLFNKAEHAAPEIGTRPIFDDVQQTISFPEQPQKWVLVAGTGRIKDLSEKQQSTAQALGRLLAHSGFGLITGGWPGVDDIVARAYSAELSKNSRPLEDFLIQIVAGDHLPAFPAGNLIMVEEGEMEYIESVNHADAVIIIGGLGGAGKTGLIALNSKKAVFPLADTDGDAKPLYLHMLKSWEQVNMPQISKMQFQTIARSAPEVASDVTKLLKLL